MKFSFFISSLILSLFVISTQTTFADTNTQCRTALGDETRVVGNTVLTNSNASLDALQRENLLFPLENDSGTVATETEASVRTTSLCQMGAFGQACSSEGTATVNSGVASSTNTMIIGAIIGTAGDSQNLDNVSSQAISNLYSTGQRQITCQPTDVNLQIRVSPDGRSYEILNMPSGLSAAEAQALQAQVENMLFSNNGAVAARYAGQEVNTRFRIADFQAIPPNVSPVEPTPTPEPVPPAESGGGGCPVVFFSSKTQASYLPTKSFLVGKFDKSLQGSSYEKLHLTNVAEKDVSETNTFSLMLAEILPEKLFLDSLSIHELQYSKELIGSWYLDFFGNPHFFSSNSTITLKPIQSLTATAKPVAFTLPSGSQINSLKDFLLSEEDRDFVFKIIKDIIQKNTLQSTANTQDFIVTKKANETAKLLITGGISTTEVDTAMSNALKRYTNIAPWFYLLWEHTILGNLVQSEAEKNISIVIEEKEGDTWKEVQKYVSYPDEPRVITFSGDFLEKTIRIKNIDAFTTINKVQLTRAENPNYSYTQALTVVPKSLEKSDSVFHIITPKQSTKLDFTLNKLSDNNLRNLFMSTSGYYKKFPNYTLAEATAKGEENNIFLTNSPLQILNISL